MYKDDRNLTSHQNSMNEQRLFTFLEFAHTAKLGTEQIIGPMQKPVIMLSKLGKEYFFPYQNVPQLIGGYLILDMPERYDDGKKAWGYIVEWRDKDYKGPHHFLTQPPPDSAA